MNKSKSFLLIIFGVVICLTALLFHRYYTTKSFDENKPTEIFNNKNNIDTDNLSEFSDGLRNPDSVTTYELNEFDTGQAEKSLFFIDINKDGQLDKITRIFNETGNSHSYYEYKIELKTENGYFDITPTKGLQTINGVSCDLQQIQFQFKPTFQIVVIYRPLGETWDDPTVAHRKTFKFISNSLQETENVKMRSVCDVKDLF